jgi:hypothetical protein
MTGIVLLLVSEPQLMRRFTLRRECPKCHKLGIESDFCPIHNVQMVRRQDTSEEELVQRRTLYKQRIAKFLQLPPIAQLPRLVFDTSDLTREEVGQRTELWVKQLLLRS